MQMEIKRKLISNFDIRQNRLSNKDYYKRQRRTLIMIKGSIQEEHMTIVNIYAPNIGAPQYIKTITTDKEGHYRMIKGSIQEEEIGRASCRERV